MDAIAALEESFADSAAQPVILPRIARYLASIFESSTRPLGAYWCSGNESGSHHRLYGELGKGSILRGNAVLKVS